MSRMDETVTMLGCPKYRLAPHPAPAGAKFFSEPWSESRRLDIEVIRDEQRQQHASLVANANLDWPPDIAKYAGGESPPPALRIRSRRS